MPPILAGVSNAIRCKLTKPLQLGCPMDPSASANAHRSSAKSTASFTLITVSDTRRLENDSSGQKIVDLMSAAGHQLIARSIVRDEINEIQSSVQAAIATNVDAIILTGGTGISPRDRTPEAVRPLLDVELPGFGELFRWLSFQEIGAAAMLSRAFAGRAGKSLVFCLPGSTAAVRLAIEQLIQGELPHLVLHSRG